MKIIKTGEIKILGKKYKVQLIDGMVDYGSTDPFKQVINIRKGLTDEMTASTLLHEIIEVINESLDLNLSHQTIQSLEVSLFSVYNDNSYAL